MIEIILPIAIVGFLAYSNGANDNFKGVATLFGSGTTNYKRALAWASLTTFLGSITAIMLASKLLATFSGKGLVPDQILNTPAFSMSVALASALTVWLATLIGFPISTTHAITGSLVGVGVVASNVSLTRLGSNFFIPLAVSPILALIGATSLYYVLKKFRRYLNIEKETCVCVGPKVIATFSGSLRSDNALALASTELPVISIGSETTCRQQYSGSFIGIRLNKIFDIAHYISAGSVCFARAINDTPKMAAVLLLTKSIPTNFALIIVAVVMTLGGIFSSKKVAETMSLRVTEMNSGQGLTGNFITSLIVIFASKMGVPVSTTHVSCGAIFGIGTVNGHAHWKTIFSIILAWITTLPVAAILGAISWSILKVIIP